MWVAGWKSLCWNTFTTRQVGAKRYTLYKGIHVRDEEERSQYWRKLQMVVRPDGTLEQHLAIDVTCGVGKKRPSRALPAIISLMWRSCRSSLLGHLPSTEGRHDPAWDGKPLASGPHCHPEQPILQVKSVTCHHPNWCWQREESLSCYLATFSTTRPAYWQFWKTSS